MTDGTGTTAYGYDSLARLSNETRTFNGLAGSYRLDYRYNLAGQLTRFTRQGSTHVDYVRDGAGQVTTVGNTGYADNRPYATNIRYRTSGAVAGVTYGNGRTLALAYDRRQRLARWDVAGLMGWDYSYDYFNEKTGRVTFADNLYDQTLDRSYEYDHVGRLAYSWTGSEAHAHASSGQWGVPDGSYAHGYRYDERGNLVERQGWGGWNASVTYPFDSQNRNTLLSYDAAGNVTGDGSQLTYDATGQQVRALYSAAGGWDIQQAYDGDRQRVKKIEGGQTTFYLRSTVLGGQVVAEYNQSGGWTRGYVYDGNAQLLATQQGGTVWWAHQDPVTKSKRVTNRQGEFVSAIDVDPWGGETSKMQNGGALAQKYTTYERDGNGRDQAMQRSYHAWFSRFDQPDPFDGSYDLSDPQSFNRYAYVQNDPVNFTDPSGLCTAADGDCVVTVTATYDYALHERALSGGRLAGGIRPRRLIPLDPLRRGGSAPPQTVPDKIISNQDVLDDLYCLWKKGGYGFKDTERSTWITNNGGAYGSVAWPWSAESKKETWKGPIPTGTVANAHTHPDRGGVKPSTTGGNTGRGDQGTADKIGLPVYVVTRNAIWKAIPNAKDPVQVAGKDWWQPSEKAKVKCN